MNMNPYFYGFDTCAPARNCEIVNMCVRARDSVWQTYNYYHKNVSHKIMINVVKCAGNDGTNHSASRTKQKTSQILYAFDMEK